MFIISQILHWFFSKAPLEYFGMKGELTKQIIEDYMPPPGLVLNRKNKLKI